MVGEDGVLGMELRGVLGEFRSRVAGVRDRSIVANPVFAAWFVLVSALPYGFEDYFMFFDMDILGLRWWPTGMAGLNFRTYHVAAEAALAGRDFYLMHPEGWAAVYSYQYPPVTLIGFFPFTVTDWWTGYIWFTGLMVVACIGCTWLLVRFIEGEGLALGWVDVGLIFVFSVMSTHSIASIYFGNINLLLAVALIIGFTGWYWGWRRTAGVAFGGAALFKVIPALIGVWLVRVRSWRAVNAAIITGVGGLVAGVVLFGFQPTWYFFTEVLVGRSGSTDFIGGYPPGGLYYVTLQRPLSYVLWEVFPSADPVWLVVCSAIVGSVVLAYFLAKIQTDMDMLIAIFVTVTLSIVIFPSYRLYLVLLYFPLIPLLYLWEGPGRWLFVIGGVLLSYTFRPGDVLDTLSAYPDVIQTVLVPIATIASVQLYGLILMLLGCARYKRSVGTSGGRAFRELISSEIHRWRAE